jgi:GntR family transcriptional repressor for pyruvate dehydrogenase complex
MAEAVQSEHRLVRPLKRRLLFEVVAEELAELILTGELQSGTKLPSENALADQFGVSRNVVREGLRSLIEQGLVAVRPGDGIYVQTPDQSTVVDAFSRYMQLHRGANWVEELYETRRLLECGIAALAAERASEDDIQLLASHLEQMRAHIDDPHEWAQADWSFHEALAESAHNSLLPLLLNPLYEQALLVFEEAWHTPRAPESGLRAHAELIRHLRDRDPKGAREAMLAHLNQSFIEVSEALESRPSSKAGL